MYLYEYVFSRALLFLSASSVLLSEADNKTKHNQTKRKRVGAPSPIVLTSAAPCVQVKLKQVGFEVLKKRRKKAARTYPIRYNVSPCTMGGNAHGHQPLGGPFHENTKKIKNISRIMTKNATKKDLREVG